MQMQHSFTVPVTVEEAWKVLLDVERIAPCLPGASLDSVEGDTFSGRVKVKVGPVSLTYKGLAEFVDRDESARTAVLSAKGKDARGNGTASARIAMALTEEDACTRVDVVTDLDLTGRPAQLGRSVIADVGERIIGQFAAALSEEIESSGPDDAPPAPAGAADSVPPRSTPDSINVLGLAGASTLRVFATAVLDFVARLFRRPRRR